MKRLLTGLILTTALSGIMVPDADAARRGGSFGGARSYSVPRTVAPRPALRQDWQRTPAPTPVYRANGATPHPAGMNGVRGQEGGRFNPAFANNYARTGFNPTARQSSFFSNPWFWMAMMGGYSMLNNTGHAQAAPAQSQAEFEANCRAAAVSPDKPADVTVTPDECAELAQLAYAKVQAEQVSPTTVMPPAQAVPVETGGNSHWLLVALGAVILLPLVARYLGRRRS